MEISEETENFLKEGNNINHNDQGVEVAPQSPSVISKKKIFKSQTLEEMREAIEIKKLQMELEKLEKPNTSIDYFQKMLELQQNHFNQLLTMQGKQSELQIELEKLKLGGEKDDGMMGYVQMLAPYIPQIIEKIGGKKNGRQNQRNDNNNNGSVYSDKVSDIIETTNNNKCDTTERQREILEKNEDEEQKETLQNREEDEEMSEKDKIIESGNITAYNELIRKGDITLEEAYYDMCEYTPYGNLVTKEQFEKKYNEIKEGK